MIASGLTDIGQARDQNQDALFVSTGQIGALPNLFLIADGMGGHNAGDVASAGAVEKFVEYIKENPGMPDGEGVLDLLAAAVSSANSHVFEQAQANPAYHGMGTTFIACVVTGGKCEIVHIGDSRLYKVSQGRLSQLTSDHTYVSYLVKSGQLRASQARKHPRRNVLTRVLGTEDKIQTDGYIHNVEEGSVLLLCTDGLTDMVPDKKILKTLAQKTTPEEKAQKLVTMANVNGGNDNISVIVIEL